jgi:hypothetical protein
MIVRKTNKVRKKMKIGTKMEVLISHTFFQDWAKARVKRPVGGN